MFPPDRRGFAMGIWGIAIMFAPALGPTLSGYITEYLDWRLIFYINVPIGVLDFFFSLALLPEYEHKAEMKLDGTGFILSTVGLFALLYGLSEVPDKGWNSPEIVFCLVLAGVTLFLFVLAELKVEQPMLDLRLFKNYLFTLTQIIGSIVSIAMFSGVFLLPLFLQNIVGLSALRTGLLMFPAALATGLMMPISGYLFDRIGAKYLAIAGLIIMTYTTYLLHTIDVNTPYNTILTWYIMRGIGMGLVMMPVTTAGMNTVPLPKVANATAISNTVRQVSSSFGIAVLTTLLANRQIYHFEMFRSALTLFSPAAAVVNRLQAQTGSGMAAKPVSEMLLWGGAQKAAAVAAMDDVFLVAAWIAAVGLFLAFFIKDAKQRKEQRPGVGIPEKNTAMMME
jgi:EmrB/QacA subfamily drug resistance transporter